MNSNVHVEQNIAGLFSSFRTKYLNVFKIEASLLVPIGKTPNSGRDMEITFLPT
jgi:hypothetical protein